tara:strand:+ start:200 stop:955 length:756 start_codon:yes stop_codon:yes gene_type:complete
MNEIYWERQVGNNCRIHSLNAFFGEKKITEEQFTEFCKEYDSLVPGLESIKMDGFAECRSIVGFIVEKYTSKYLQLVPINLRNVHKKNREFWNYDRFASFFENPDGILGFFEFNRDHIWFNKYTEGEWFKIDSLSGVTKINKIRHFGENGFLLVFENELKFKEIMYLIDFIKSNKDLDELDIAFNNLYHLLSNIKLEYDKTDDEFNTKLSNLKIIFKLLGVFINLNRRESNVKTKTTIKSELKSIIDSSIF